MELSPDNLKIFISVLSPMLAPQKYSQRCSPAFWFKNCLQMSFLGFGFAVFPAVSSGATTSPSGRCSDSPTRSRKGSGTAQERLAARPGPRCRRRNITRALGGSDGFTNGSGRRRGQEESIALDLSLNKGTESCWSRELTSASYNVDHTRVLLSCAVNTPRVGSLECHLWWLRCHRQLPQRDKPSARAPSGWEVGVREAGVGLGGPGTAFAQDMSWRDERGKAR